MNEWELTPTFVLFVDNLVARSSTAFRLFSSNKSRDDRVPHYEATCINNARGALGLFLLPCFVVVTGAAVVVDPVTTASSVSFWIDPDGRAGGVRGKKLCGLVVLLHGSAMIQKMVWVQNRFDFIKNCKN
jgi:hypothetical protein